MINIGIVGWNGKKNVGDDAMTAAILRYITGFGKKQVKFQLYAPPVNYTQYTPESNSDIRGLPWFNFFNRKFLKRVGSYYVLPNLFTKCKDLILFGGGSIFHREATSISQLKLIRTARLRNRQVKIGAIGVSIGPFYSQREYDLVKSIIAELDFIVLRDDRSYKLAESMNLRTPIAKAPDLAFLLQSYHEPDVPYEKRKQTLGISLRANHVKEEQFLKYRDIIINWLSKNEERQVNLYNFSELVKHNDHVETLRLIKRIPMKYYNRIKITRYSNNPLNFYQEISKCHVMFCMRLHAAILSYAVGTIPIIDPYHQKCLDFAHEVKLPKKYILRKIDKNIIDNLFENLEYENLFANGNPQELLVKKSKEHFQFINDLISG